MKNKHPAPSHTSHTSSGFTIIELMLTLGLLGVLVALAMPSLREWRQNTQMVTVTNSVVNALSVARTEALKRNRPVAVSFITSGTTKTGWRIYADNDFDKAFDATKGDEELFNSTTSDAALPSFISLTSSKAQYIYDGSGFARGFNDTIKVQNMDGSTVKAARHVKISNTGRVRTCTPTTPTGECAS